MDEVFTQFFSNYLITSNLIGLYFVGMIFGNLKCSVNRQFLYMDFYHPMDWNECDSLQSRTFRITAAAAQAVPVKGWKFWPSLGTHGHWAVRVLWRPTPFVTLNIRLYDGHLRGLVTFRPVAGRLAVELSLPVLNLRLMSVATVIQTPNLPQARWPL